MGPADLYGILEKLPQKKDENLLVGYNSDDDAAVYIINDTEAIIQTVDFFPPNVSDPYIFGKIAATNAVSDIFAMGGDVTLALNILAFPKNGDKDILSNILKGGQEVVNAAGGIIAGGHTISDNSVKYGLSVTGKVKLDGLIKNNTVNAGDHLILTKPLGVGIIVSAYNAGEATDVTKESISDVLRGLFSDAVRSYYSNYNLPTDVIEKIAVSNDIDKLIAIEVSNSYKDIKDTNPSIEDTPELKKYIVETQGYSNNELENIINQNVNIENFRNLVVPDVEEKILNEALVDDVTLNNFLDKLSVEDMIEIYKTSDVNSFLQRFQRA